MTTAIRDAAGKGRSWIIRDADTHVSITGSTSDGTIDRASLVDRAEFLAAVANELDVIVIPRTDLPNVTDRYGLLTAINGTQSDSATTSNEPDQLRRKALNILALAEHLEKHPPIDEAAVDALTALIRASDEAEGLIGDELDDAYHRTIARHLVKSGVRVPQAGDDQ